MKDKVFKIGICVIVLSLVVLSSIVVATTLSSYSKEEIDTTYVIGNKKIKGLYLKDTEAIKGRPLYLDLIVDNNLENLSVSITFNNSVGEEFTLDVYDVSTNPYIIVPTNFNGLFNIKEIVFRDNHEVKRYSANKGSSNYLEMGSNNFIYITDNTLLNRVDLGLYGNYHKNAIININLLSNDKINKAYIYLINENTEEMYSINIDLLTNTFKLPLDITSGLYKVAGLKVYSDTYYKYYDAAILNISQEFNILNTQDVDLTNLIITNEEGLKNSFISVTVESKSSIQRASLTYYNEETNKHFTSIINNLDSDSYFAIPNIENGTYNLEKVTLIDNDNNIKEYKKADKSFIDSTIKVIGTNTRKTSLYLDNSLIDNKSINNIDDYSSIIIDANKNSIIKSSVFKEIKGKNKLLTTLYKNNIYVFRGSDIKSINDFDISMNIITSTKFVSDFANTLQLAFNESEELPGTILLKINNTGIIKDIFKDDSLNIYGFTNSNYFNKISLANNLSNNKYKVYLTTTDDVVLTNTRISGKYISNNESYFTLNKQATSNNTITIIAIIVFSIMIVVIIMYSSYLVKKSLK